MSPLTKRVFLDFDNTLYDTAAMMVSVQQDMQDLGADRKEIERTRKQLNTEGYSFERHLVLLGFPPETITRCLHTYERWLTTGDRFLFPGVAEGMMRLSKIAECHLLTLGFPPYQRRKVHGVASLRGLFTARHYVWRDMTKGDIASRYSDQLETFFLDDTAAHLEEVRQSAPWTTCIQMKWPQGKAPRSSDDEQRWGTVHSFEEFIRIVEGNLC